MLAFDKQIRRVLSNQLISMVSINQADREGLGHERVQVGPPEGGTIFTRLWIFDQGSAICALRVIHISGLGGDHRGG